MLITLIQWILISFILIALVHYIFTFLKTNLTVPKVKDLIDMPSKRYKEIIESIDNKKQIDNASNKMKDELKQYMASLMINKNNNNNNANNVTNKQTNLNESINFQDSVSNSKLDYSYSDF